MWEQREVDGIIEYESPDKRWSQDLVMAHVNLVGFAIETSKGIAVKNSPLWYVDSEGNLFDYTLSIYKIARCPGAVMMKEKLVKELKDNENSRIF